jgi:catechol 2,3-dioxygenase-like lactoylglutathione lyase family enzyme
MQQSYEKLSYCHFGTFKFFTAHLMHTQSSPTNQPRSWRIHKLREIVKSVRSLENEMMVWEGIMGWKTLHKGVVGDDQLAFWNVNTHVNAHVNTPNASELPDAAAASPISANEILCGFAGETMNDYGLLRLVQFVGCKQVVVRSGAQIWETGGIFDFDLRVRNLHATYEALVNAGYYVFGEPIELRIGNVVLNETLLFGPEAAGLALVDRVQPPLPASTPESHGILGTIYLTVTVAKNMDATARFFTETLGFTALEDHIVQPASPQPTVFRLPWNLSTSVPVRLAGFSPDGTRDTMIEVFQFDGIYGEDRSERALPPNLGLLMYRFPVDDIEAYWTFVAENMRRESEANSAESSSRSSSQSSFQPRIVADLQTILMPPYGTVRAFALRSPDGVWIEFFEEIS